MPTARMIFPFGGTDTLYHTFKIFFLSEGYLNSEKSKFTSDCLESIEAILSTSPFNLSKAKPNWLSVYQVFVPSNNSGPSLNTPPTAGNTAFDSHLDTSTGVLSFDQSKIVSLLETVDVSYFDENVPLSEFYPKGKVYSGLTGCLVVILLPKLLESGEYEHIPIDETSYYFVSTSKNNYWHQVIMRGIGSSFGLGNEYELSGNDFLAPSSANKIIPYFNLEYFDVPPVTMVNPGDSKWFSLFSSTQRLHLPAPNIKTDPNSVDTTLPTIPSTPNKIEFWEGGGGYRTKVYRSAHDCLMRRRIGDAYLPVRSNSISFCFACSHLIRNLLK